MTWQKGQSGNPHGQRRMDAAQLELRDLARTFSVRAIERIAEIMESDDPRCALHAADLLLQRGFGRVVPVDSDIWSTADKVSSDDGSALVAAVGNDPDARRALDRVAARAARLARDPGLVR